ncbi:MAG: SEC-C domain-containing protein, partial [Desulfobacter sp.]|nr:SEC-C domain-containing protein [Desulfobacter sp.]
LLLNKKSFEDCLEKARQLELKIIDKHNNIQQNEDVINDFFVLSRFIDFLSAYMNLWKKLLNHEFSSSWNSLQDSLDLLRLIKKFSSINIGFFEDQLLELEKTYPYNIFLSIGATVEKFECSLCGEDIDSADCPHMKGELYGGKMAQGIAKNIVEANHVSFVSIPKDKRCVVKYEDTGEQFKLVRYLSDLINNDRFNIFDFGELQFSKKLKLNPDYVKVGRNEPCFCGSEKKFKRCCISKEYIEGDHVDIVATPKTIDNVIASKFGGQLTEFQQLNAPDKLVIFALAGE